MTSGGSRGGEGRGAQQSTGQQRESHDWGVIRGEINGVVPVSRRAEQNVAGSIRDEGDFLENLTIVRGVHSHLVSVENVDDALLAAGDEFMGSSSALIGKYESSGGTHVKVVGIEVGHA